jgi:hypothetical protein
VQGGRRQDPDVDHCQKTKEWMVAKERHCRNGLVGLEEGPGKENGTTEETEDPLGGRLGCPFGY